MAGKVKFYRGAQGTSLPVAHQDGAIFIIERSGSNNLGDMYVDMDNGKRLHIIPDSEFITYTPIMSSLESIKGQVYVFQETGKTGVAVGDGTSLVGDLPVYSMEVKNRIQAKVNAYLGTDYINLSDTNRAKDKNGTKRLDSDFPKVNGNFDTNIAAETLVLTRELWIDF